MILNVLGGWMYTDVERKPGIISSGWYLAIRKMKHVHRKLSPKSSFLWLTCFFDKYFSCKRFMEIIKFLFIIQIRYKPNHHYNQLTPWSRVLLEKLTVTQLIKKFLAFYGTRMFITVFKRAGHFLLSCVIWIQSRISNPTCLRYIQILTSHLLLDLPRSLFRSGFAI